MKKIIGPLLLSTAFLFSVAWTKPPQSTARENYQKYTDKLLPKILLTEKDLGFEKKYAKDDFRLKVVDDILDEPLLLIDVMENTDNNITKNLSDLPALYASLADYLDLQPVLLATDDTAPNVFAKSDPKEFPPELRQFMNKIASSYYFSSGLLKDSLKNVDNDKFKAYCQEFILEKWDPSITKLKQEDFKDYSEEKFLEMAKKVDMNELIEGFASLISDYSSNIKLIKNLNYSSKTKKIIDSPYGKIIIGSSGNDVYTEKAFMIIDFNGDDIYKDEATRSKFILDFKGNDFYSSKVAGSLGSGIFDYSIFEDFEGDDIYRTSHYSQGSGYFGAGMFIDDKGNDIYESDEYSQGSALFGTGILLDREGNDKYYAAEHSQGFSQTKGVGALIDAKGNDAYFAGGKYLHEPLYADVHRSLSQGFSIGFRPAASGGVAIMWDGEGNDKYDGQVYCQGAGYWFSLGMLIDKEGNDSYTGHIYGQGGGIHLAAGGLYDKNGMDMFSLLDGVGQGGAHDWAVAGLINLGKNNDLYSGSGITRGSSHANGVGFFYDEGGNDVYTGKKTDPSQNGYGTKDRNSISVGLFVDAGGGLDSYYPNGNDNEEWIGGFQGIGYDEPAEIKQANTPKQDAPKTEETFEKLIYPQDKAKIDELYNIATQWGVGTNAEKVPMAQKTLAKAGPEVAQYIFRAHIKAPTTLETRALTVIANENKDKVLSLFKEFIDANDDSTIRSCLALMVDLGITYEQLQKHGFTDEYLKSLITRNYGSSVYSILGNTGNNNVVNILWWALDNQKDLSDKSWISLTGAIGRTGNENDATQLISRINNNDSAIKRFALEDGIVMILRKNKEVRAQILKKWKFGTHEVKDIHVLRACARSENDKGNIKTYIKIAKSDSDTMARLYAVEGIRRLMKSDKSLYDSYLSKLYDMYKQEKESVIRNKIKSIVDFVLDAKRPDVEPY